MRRLLTACLALAAAGPAAADDYPKVELKTKGLKMTVYLPGAEKGFYRGTRFDWSGVIGPVEFAGRKLFGPWKATHDPTNYDDILGPVEEFSIERPLGYDEAKVGEAFLKIGVGELVKPKEARYDFFRKYKIVKPGRWEVKRNGDEEIQFIQEVKAANGYGYRYVRTVCIDSEPPVWLPLRGPKSPRQGLWIASTFPIRSETSATSPLPRTSTTTTS